MNTNHLTIQESQRPPEVSPHLSSGSSTSRRFIKLSRSRYSVIVDADKYEWLNQWKWGITKIGKVYYALRTTRNENNIRALMHRFVLGLKKGQKQEVDHINHNGLDNRLANLRICTHRQNLQNSLPRKNTSSKYKGVCWHKRPQKWVVNIKCGHKLLHLGYYDTEIEAAKAYDRAAKEYFGEFAYTNF